MLTYVNSESSLFPKFHENIVCKCMASKEMPEIRSIYARYIDMSYALSNSPENLIVVDRLSDFC
jgi:hypothetical protein